ncbi:helix-turn-helix domain-containing protein [Robertmurraya andreesenii]|uniref:XRE family transcriptional regulator of biofilm formation n=1 Tax=Anoxybacillus andreesenii TaxID=1325932 RepID=A0ABT9V329_9BACL|nr:helix-turn-helix transcriptional regulator [Robertmurraya andreesenii]MDQ0155358.1 XRE family transcriptional regulator of biofilm formation [Robertmurraya andreesenii]
MIGKNIAEIRKRRGYTLSELAELSNISKSYLSNIERNINKNPTIDVIQKIAKVLNVDFMMLIEPDLDIDSHLYIEQEWSDLLKELKELGIEKKEIQEYKTLVEFIKWQKQNCNHVEKI